MSPWCPLPTIRSIRSTNLVAHSSARNGTCDGSDLDADVRDLAADPVTADLVDERAQRPTTIPALAGIGGDDTHSHSTSEDDDETIVGAVGAVGADLEDE
jgi:hypothetical protein